MLFRAKSLLPKLQLDEVNVIHDVEILWLYASQRLVSIQNQFKAFTYPSNTFTIPGGDVRRARIDRYADSLFKDDEIEKLANYTSAHLELTLEVTEHLPGEVECYNYMLWPIVEDDRLICIGDHGQYANSRSRWVLHFLPYKLPKYDLPFLVEGEINGTREWVGIKYPHEFSVYDNIVAPKIL